MKMILLSVYQLFISGVEIFGLSIRASLLGCNTLNGAGIVAPPDGLREAAMRGNLNPAHMPADQLYRACR
jgi:hypothetical protein